MSNQIQTGKLLSNRMVGVKDALHIPVICLIAHKTLSPGERVGISKEMTTSNSVLGVVDPFLETPILEGSVCAVFLSPDSTTNVRHLWEHPDIDDLKSEPPSSHVESWDVYADRICNVLGCKRSSFDNSVDYVVEYGTNVGGYQLDLDTIDLVDWGEFWREYNYFHKTNFSFTEDPFCC